MGRETYTYILNQEKINSNLIPALQDEKLGAKSFSNFLKEKKRSIGLTETLLNLKDVHSKATVEQLGTVLNWIWDANNLSHMYDSEKIWEHLGFELIYELGQKDKCWVYGNQSAEFEYMNEATFNVNYYDGYYFYSSHDYKNYLDYLLLLLKKICSDQEYENSPNENLDLPNDYIKTDILDQQTDLALIDIRRENQEEDKNEAVDINYRRFVTASHYIVAEEMFYQITEVRELIKKYNGKILIFDSI